jgi:S1-C subfamily serine protease
MKTTLLIAVVVCALEAGPLFAQPVLNRVEQFLRDQLGVAPTERAADAGYLGLVVDDRQEPGVVRVTDVVVGGAAAQAGIQKGDIVTSVDGRAIRTTDDMMRAVARKPAGAKLIVSVMREGESRNLNVTLGRRALPAATRGREELPGPTTPAPDANAVAPPPRLGVRTLPVSDEAREQNKLPDNSGAMVILVAAGSPADAAGVPLGAVIKAVGNAPVNSPQELAAAIGRATGSEVELTWMHQGAETRKRIALGTGVQDSRVQVRARPPVVAPPAPADTAPIAPDNGARIESLETRIRALEERIKELESRLTPAPAGDTEKPQ